MDSYKTAYLGLLTAFALILSYVETLLPFPMGVPGMKLGLANLAVVLCLYLFDAKGAVLLTIVKAVVSALLFGNLFMLAYSLAGALLSVFVMILLKKGELVHLPIVSAAGGVAHNLGQLLVAMLVVESYSVLSYMPVLLITGLITGSVIGLAASVLLPYLKELIRKGSWKE